MLMDSKGFNLWADNYDKDVQLCEEDNEYPFAGYKDVLGTIYNRIREGNGKKILDIGFGTGVLAKKLYDDGITVFGMDFSEEMIRLVKEKMPEAVLHQHDFSKGLPEALQDQKFDFITCTYAIHHLTEEQKLELLALLRSHLTKRGEILLGDVIFETEKDQTACQEKSGDEWDDEEMYIVVERLRKELPGMEFIKISYCSGVCVIK